MSEISFDVNGKVYAITGAAGALCGVMARELAMRGARVALLDIAEDAVSEAAERINALAQVRAAGGEAIAVVCDVLDEEAISAAARKVRDVWGVPDVLINGAGGNHPSGSANVDFASAEAIADPESTTFFDLPNDGFRRVFDLNFLGTVLPTRVIGREMAQRGSGCVINMSSMSALTPLTRVGAYSAAKSAVASITSWLAVHLAPSGIRVNALAPGFFMTEQLRFLHIDQETGEYTPRAGTTVGSRTSIS